MNIMATHIDVMSNVSGDAEDSSDQVSNAVSHENDVAPQEPVSVQNETPDVANSEQTTAEQDSSFNELIKNLDDSSNDTKLFADIVPDTSEDSVALLKTVSTLQCPFAWRIDLSIKTYGDHDFDILADFEELYEETGFRFRGFVIHLILCYYNYYKRRIEQAQKNLKELENMLYVSAKRESHDILFNTINDALFHVAHSMRLYFLKFTNQNKHALQILPKIKSYSLMTDANKAGIWGIRASVYAEYGYEGVKTALTHINKAIMLDGKNAYWHFMKGTYLGRLRRMEKCLTIPSEEEIRCLETAMTLKEDSGFIAFTAEVYMEVAKGAALIYKEKCIGVPQDTKDLLFNKLDNCNLNAAKLFVKSVELKPNCAHFLFRCGKGLMKLPEPHQDLELASKYLRAGLQISPNSSFGNHAMAMYREKCSKDITSAKQHLQVAVDRKNFQAHMDFCRLSFLEDNDGDNLITQLTELSTLYSEIPKRCRILSELICSYLFVNYNLAEACACMKELLELKSDWITYNNEFHSGILPFSRAVPLIQIICSEMKNRFSDKSITEEDRDAYKRFWEFLCLENIDVPSNISPGILKFYSENMKMGLERRARQFSEQVRRKEEKSESAESKPRTQKSRRPLVDKEYLKYYKNDALSDQAGKSHMLSSPHKGNQRELFDRLRKTYKESDSGDESSERIDEDRSARYSGRKHSSKARSTKKNRKTHSSESDSDTSKGSKKDKRINEVISKVGNMSIDKDKKKNPVKENPPAAKEETECRIPDTGAKSERPPKAKVDEGESSSKNRGSKHQSPEHDVKNAKNEMSDSESSSDLCIDDIPDRPSKCDRGSKRSDKSKAKNGRYDPLFSRSRYSTERESRTKRSNRNRRSGSGSESESSSSRSHDRKHSDRKVRNRNEKYYSSSSSEDIQYKGQSSRDGKRRISSHSRDHSSERHQRRRHRRSRSRSRSRDYSYERKREHGRREKRRYDRKEASDEYSGSEYEDRVERMSHRSSRRVSPAKSVGRHSKQSSRVSSRRSSPRHSRR